MKTEVEYRTLDWLPGYRIGSDGSVWSSRSCHRLPVGPDGWRRLAVAVRSTPRDSKRRLVPYLSIALRPQAGAKLRGFYIHRLVCEAFHGPAPFAGAVVCHADDVCDNNVPENLRWATAKENSADAFRNGRIKLRLSPTDLADAWEMLAAGSTLADVAARFRVHWSCAQQSMANAIAAGRLPALPRPLPIKHLPLCRCPTCLAEFKPPKRTSKYCSWPCLWKAPRNRPK